MSFMWTANHNMTPEEAVTHLRRSLVGINWQAVQVLAGEIKQLRAQRAAALALHEQDGAGFCKRCVSVWPCQTQEALGAETAGA